MPLPVLRFDVDQAQAAFDAVGANCGPGALAALLGITPMDAVAVIPGFVEKRYTKETMMRPALQALGVCWEEGVGVWPRFGLARVLWDGPWSDGGQIARFEHSHWVASVLEGGQHWIFDINAVGVGWLSYADWSTQCVPWLLARCEPQARGGWELWEGWEVVRPLKAA